MRISFPGLCRGDGKTFLKTVVKSLACDAQVHLTCSTPEDAQVPCGLYPDGAEGDAASYVAVFPQLTAPLDLTFDEQDDQGHSLESPVTITIDPKNAKWRSRIAYRLQSALAAEIRNFDDRFAQNRAMFHFEQVILWEGMFKVRGRLEIPCAKDEDIELHCFASDLMRPDAEFVIMRDEADDRRDGALVRKLEFAIDVPNCGCNYVFAAAVKGKPALSGFDVLEEAKALELANEWFLSHIDAQGDSRYLDWFERHRASQAELAEQARASLDDAPLFSIVVPLYKTPPSLFDDMVLSVRAQSYGKWELLLVNASPEDAQLQERIDRAVASDDRIREVRCAENRGISLNTRAGIEAARGEFIAFLDHDDTIEPNLLFEYARTIADDKGADLLYCDEDHILPDGEYGNPTFKPDFSIDFLRSGNYVCHMLCVRKSILDTIELPDKSHDGAQDQDMTLKMYEAGARMRHVPRVLYHWRMAEGSTALDPDTKPYAAVAGVKVVSEHLQRMGVEADVDHGQFAFTYAVTYRPSHPHPLVSVIIPTKDQVAALIRCVDSVEAHTDYDNYEIVLVENNSVEGETFRAYERLRERYENISVVRFEGDFNFSKIVNFGAARTHGELLLFLNNDTEVISDDWMTRMAGICAREEVGVVGARLWYPDNTLQHGGAAIIGESVSHLQFGVPRGYLGYLADPQKIQNLSAVTGACMMTKRDVFEQVGGFDERLAVAYNDIDYCLKVRETGKLVVYDPSIQLYHYESLSRGYEEDDAKQERFSEELSLFKARWARYYAEGDPYYNKNFLQTTGFYQLGV